MAKVYPGEFASNYDGGDINSNPFSGVAFKDKIYIVDAGKLTTTTTIIVNDRS